MGLGCSGFVGLGLLIIAGLCYGQGDFRRVGSLGLQYQYSCGEYSMQLMVFPSPGREVRFKLLDEDGIAFEVSNCSICHHWITFHERNVAFSVGYNGCRVLKKDGRMHLKVHLEELTSNRITDARDINMICPKPQEHLLKPEDNLPYVPHPGPASLTQPPQHGRVRPLRPQAKATQPSLMHPLQPQPSLVRPPQSGLVRPLQPQPQQPQPGLVRPSQPEPPKPSLERLLQPQPQPGLELPPQPGSSLTLEQCQVSSGKIPCVSAEGPAACYHTGCCYDERDQMIPCYYGNTATVQCLQDGYFILAVSRDMLDYPIILDSVKLSYAQGRCDPVRKTESFLLFRFPLTQCGTTVQVTGGRLIYENQLVSGIDILSGPDGFITRDSTFILHARCIYNATDFLPVQGEVFSAPTPAPVIQVGPLRLELRIATDSTYRSYYSDYPVVKVLREPVHVEVRILQRMDPSLVLVLHECWATPSTNPLEQLQWPILAAGCPFKGDNYRTQLVPMGPATSEVSFPNHYQRFIISTFTFVDSAPRMVLDGLVYLFCSVSVCHPSQLEPCRVACQEFSEMHNGTQSLDLVSTNGAVIFQGSSQSHEKQVKWEKGKWLLQYYGGPIYT
uniref:Zona pellucida glycoprotein 1 n=1 Tax=Varanus komodoensis TaxID=61221 RepID=A0A8D2IVL4_VARKO